MKKEYVHALWVSVLSVLGLMSCQENEHMIYGEKAAVYFSTLTENDSLSYSFAAGLTEEDVVSIPVTIIGEQSPEVRKIAFSVDPASTAVEGTHFKNLPAEQLLPAGAVETSIDVTVMDNELENGDVTLILNLETNDDFDLGKTGHYESTGETFVLGYAAVALLWQLFKSETSVVHTDSGIRLSACNGF